MAVTIDLDDEIDRWQWVCPRGHRSWEPTNHHFWCSECARHWDVDPEFDELRNERTRERVARDEIVLTTAAGPRESVERRGGR